MENKARPKLKVKHREIRRRRHQSAWITLENGTANCKCQVEDVSRNGAKITLDRAVEVGKLFDIAFVPRAAGRRCEVVWRRGNMLGIRFIG